MSSDSFSKSLGGWSDAATSMAYLYPAFTTIVILVLGLLLPSLALRSSSRKRSRATPPAPKCYRIQQIPVSVKEDELLHQLGYPSTKQPAASLPLTLARSFGQYRTATFVSTNTPKNLEYPIDTNFVGITPLYETKDATVDIIAVHGLGSHAIGGFRSKDSSLIWLRDFLPEDIPNTRILVYGYDSAITDKDNKISITGLAKGFLESCKAFREATETTRRPIIFIGHSLGGLLIKEALTIAFDGGKDPRNDEFFKSSYGLVFFGVPNLGIRLGKLKEITSGQINAQLIHDLELDSESEPTPYLRSLQDKFISCHRKLDPPMRIISYYEERKTITVIMDNKGNLTRGGDPCFMVTQESACRVGFQDNTHDKQPLPSDHSSLVKFSGQADPSYRIVQHRLRTLVKDGPGVISRRFQAQVELSEDEKRHWDDLNVPDYRAFIENEEKLAKPVEGTLQWLLGNDPTERPYGTSSLQHEDFEGWIDDTKSSTLLILGPPGQGKSVLSNFVVNHLQQSLREATTKVIYFFCNIKDGNARNAESVLKALIVQLCKDQRLFWKLPNRFQDRGGDRSFQSAYFDDLWRTFHDLVQHSPYQWIYCIIDGLDVYETGMKDLVTKLHEMIKQGESRIKLFLTSRPTGPVGAFPSEIKRFLKQPNKDMDIFIKKEIESLPSTFNSHMKETIFHHLLDTAGGTFLWVHIVIRKLKNMRYISRGSVQDVLNTTPQELDELYTTLVRAAFREDYDVAILAWVSHAMTPLSIQALEAAVTVMLTDSNSLAECSENKPFLNDDSIRANLGTLVDVIDDTVFLIHQSLLDFLRSKLRIWSEGNPSLELGRPNVMLGRACLKRLNFNDFNLEKETLALKDCQASLAMQPANGIRYCAQDLYEEDPFLFYASNYWYSHIESAEDLGDYMNNLLRILQGPNNCVWLRRLTKLLEHPKSRFRRDSLEKLLHSVPHIAAFLNSAWLVRVVRDKALPNLSDTFTDDCLRLATESGAVDSFRELLREGISPRLTITEEVVTVIAGQGINGKEMMELLLERRDDEIKITLEVLTAAAGNYLQGKEMLDLLLEQRDRQNQSFTTVLTTEADRNNKNREVLDCVLEGSQQKLPLAVEILTEAANNYFQGKEILEFLLEKRGDEVRIFDKVVLAAARNDNQGKEILELLLDKRCDEVQVSDEVVTEAARDFRHGKESLELLLEKRGDEIQVSPNTVRAAAGNCFHGKEILELLFEKTGGEIQASREVVTAAAGNWIQGEQILELLFERRGDEVQVSLEVLTAASSNYSQWREIFELLLERRGHQVVEAIDVLPSRWKKTLQLILEKWGDEFQFDLSTAIATAEAEDGSSSLEILLRERCRKIQMNPDVVLAAADTKNGRSTLEMLLSERGYEIRVLLDVILEAAKTWCRIGALEVLLEKSDDKFQVVREMVRAIVEFDYGPDVLGPLLDKKWDGIQITTDDIVLAAVRSSNWRDFFELLFEKKGDEIQITPKVLITVFDSEDWRDQLELLFEEKGDKIQVTSEVVTAAAESENGKDILGLLFEKKGDEIDIILEAVEASESKARAHSMDLLY
ncbi:unnamed protein product [Clonostachys rosea]|uniref:Nephrocystin 3-like N-terminal domain-containing protein n=1 Tax=Bionectria ochroleuca TaxID=29856 RepID=A0ABY6UUV4_BIOOC|nr:unnamed protein product [Clonostachys rosea]